MLKRLLLSLLSVFILCGGAAATTDEAAIRQTVTDAVKSYAASVYQPDAADEAFEDFLIQGFFVNSGTMPIQDRDPFVASIFNSCLMQEALAEGISEGIVLLQKLQQDTLYLAGGPSWHNYYYSYSYMGYLGEKKDFTCYLGSVVNTKNIYGENHYTGPRNRNDDVMELLVGGIEGGMVLYRTVLENGRESYRIKLNLQDHFDFDSDYSKIQNKGFDTSKDVRLKNLGLLLKLFGLSDFYWEFSTELTVEVPAPSSAEGQSFHWVYDTATQEMVSDTANGFSENTATAYDYTTSSGKSGRYYELDTSVMLQHDKPWVVSYQMQPSRSLTLSPRVSNSACLPTLYHYNYSYIWLYHYQRFNLTPEEIAAGIKSRSTSYYAGAELYNLFRYSSKDLFTYVLENVPDGKGGNTIYCSIFNHTLGQRVYGPVALDTLWTKANGASERTLTERGSSYASGKDVVINYIGNQSVPILPPTDSASAALEISIWTEGTDQIPNWPEAPVQVRGTVKDTAGAAVSLVAADGNTDVTVKSSGTFRGEIDAPCFDIVISAPGCLTTTVKNVSPPGNYVPLGEITLLRGDVNGDEMINIMDMATFRQNFGKTGETILNVLTDTNGDGMVNIMDMGTFRQNFGKTAEKDCTTVYLH